MEHVTMNGATTLHATHSPDAKPASLAASPRPWWRGAVIYQIYPRSFRDSNDDGVGDLPGVIEGLDHVARLGVDAVWLSPFFKSPMRDFGYDVSDYCDVDPIFGTLADFDRVIEKAHRLGLKVLIDQVYSHTSDDHAWFAQSRQCRSNPKADWYVWADPKDDGSPPNNWQSVFGGGAWTWDARRGQYYLHNFLPSQPQINQHNPDVQNALIEAARFWLDRGVDGFRLDAINFGMHDPLLRDNPPAPKDGRRITRPFDFQRHLYNQSHTDIPKFLERIRQLTDQYEGCFTVAEVGGPEPLAEMKLFTEGGRRLDSAYNFDFLYAPALTPALAAKGMRDWPGEAGEGWPSWAFSNHDAPRALSRWAVDADRAAAAKLYLLVLLALRGNAFIYQGEELGLPQADVAFEDLKDPEAIANWPLTLGRDGARTPLPWRADRPHAGFSTAKPWLPVDARHVALSVAAQEADTGSTLAFAREAIAARRATPALQTGSATFLDAPDGVLAFTRRSAEGDALCVFNLTGADVSYKAPPGARAIIATGGATVSASVLPRLSGYVAAI